MTKLIIIRGNSGSGKTTLATAVRNQLGKNTMLISQDVVRLNMLNIKDRPHNLAIELIYDLCDFGRKNCQYVILEGILSKAKYGNMLVKLMATFDETYIYYLNMPFETTVARNDLREASKRFSPATLRKWWLSEDQLADKNERIINSDFETEKLAELILMDVLD